MGSSSSKRLITLLSYLFAIIIHYSSLSCGCSNVGCNARDREALEIFKGSIEDPWQLLSSWSTEQDCCHWFGIQCDNLTRRVTELDLHCADDNKCLGGQINLYVLKLEFLSFLDLRENNFYAIYNPPTNHNMSLMSNFSNLVFLDFSYNHGLRMDDLTWISQLSSLKYLNLSDADLSKETFWLQSVNMLPSLLELRLSHCFLKKIQPSLNNPNSSSLQVLDISRNDFYNEVPKWLFNLSSSISFLDLSFNYITGQVPEELLNFRQLKSLVLSFNTFEGQIPEWVGQYKQLENIDFTSNYFSGPIPETLVNLSSLKYLNVRCNLLNGSLPKSLGKHSELLFFFAGYNLLSGSISPFLCQAVIGNKNLKALGLRHNHFSGKLLDCWTDGKSPLMAILLGSNNFSGSIPPQICQLSNLQFLDLADNKISGSIPKCLGNIAAKYTTSYLQRSSQFPSRTYEEYQHLLYRECLEEESSFLSRETLMFYSSIDLSMNDFSGSIPRELFRSDKLMYLNLSYNRLTGSIPDEIGHMKSLESLDLSRNQLVGEIPQSIINLNILNWLDVSYNNLSGKIPLGTQLQASSDPSSYMGNPELYCDPLPNNKPPVEEPNEKDEIIVEGSGDEFTKAFKMGMAIGLAYGFWGVCFALFFINPWRIAYFRFLNNIYDRIYVFVALKIKWLRQNFANSPK